MGNINQSTVEGLFESPDFAKMWLKMHTPYLKKFAKVGRNDVCPYCNSGKKFKNCECYEQFGKMKYTNKYEKDEI